MFKYRKSLGNCSEDAGKFVLDAPCAEEPWRAFSLLALSCFETKSTKYNLSQKKRNQKLMARDQRMKHIACILHTHRLMLFFFAKKISKLYLLTHCVVRTLEMRQQTSVVCSHAFPDREHSSRCFHHVQPHAAIFDQFHQLDDHSIMGS